MTASTALFGGDPTIPPPASGEAPLRFGHGEGVHVVREPSNPYGCLAYTQRFHDHAILVQRGECTFLEKLVAARLAGASGVVVLSDEDMHLNPSADLLELAAVKDVIKDAVIVVLKRAAGDAVSGMMDTVEHLDIGRVMVVVEPEPQPAMDIQEEQKNTSRDINRVLYLNGHPLLNTRLMV